MAEELGQARTEAPTPRRRQEAREQGSVAVSTDLSASLILLAAVIALWVGSQTLGMGLLQNLRIDLQRLGSVEVSVDNVQHVFYDLFGRGLQAVGVLLGLLLVVGLAAGVLQVGFHVLPELLSFKWERLLPSEGVQRMFSLASGLRAVTALLKVSAIMAVAWWVLRGRAEVIAGLGEGSVAASFGQGWILILRLAVALAGALLVIGVIDYGFQRFRYERSLRMTRQELKEEIKREEGDPQVKARIRRLQREAAQKRMLQEVPKATVVITNPQHLAVALRYDRATMPAPRVVAKGAGFVAARIISMAKTHRVPVIERKPLAQALHRTVEVGKEIPAALYLVVAELLAHVYRLQRAA